MNRSQKERQESLFRTQKFMVDFNDKLGDVNSTQPRISLDRVVSDLEGLAGFQQHAPVVLKSRAVQKEDLREALRLENMQPIAAVARLKLSDSPLIVKLMLPPKGLDDASLIAAGDGMAEAAAQYKDVFLAQHFAPTFIEDLKAAIDAVRNSVVDREGMRVQRSFTRTEVKQRLNEGTHLVQILEGLVMKHIRGNPALVEAWKTAKGIRGRPSRGKAQDVLHSPVTPASLTAPENGADASLGSAQGEAPGTPVARAEHPSA